VKELLKIFPSSQIRYEIIKARTENGKGKGFSPAMVGQKVMLEWLEQLRSTTTQEGWLPSILRQQLGLAKEHECTSTGNRQQLTRKIIVPTRGHIRLPVLLKQPQRQKR
jgi:hypothetical protein